MGNCSAHRVIEPPCTQSYFDVFNVDAKLLKHSRGRIQITNEELVLYYKNSNETVRWPLKGLRRYGYHKDIFLFECGRKCPTGEGLFAFKCNKAKRLNESLKKTILNNSTTLVKLDPFVKQVKNYSKKINDMNSQSRLTINRENSISSSTSSSSKPQYLEPQDTNTPRVFTMFKNESSEPYYVNQNYEKLSKQLVKLPSSLSFVNNSSNNFKQINDSEQIDPCILHLVKNNLNAQSNDKMTCQQEKSSSSSSTSSCSSSSHSSNLIYVVAERFNNNINNKKLNSSLNDLSQNQSNQQSLQPTDDTSKSKRNRNEISSTNSSQIEYSTIDLDKGMAIQKSQKQNHDKRMEYSMISYK